jgi:deazaflavin-dependent oxidoreductase (nitroreductase family)
MWQNPIITAILKSPLHRIMSGNILLLTVTGRKTRKEYTFPISYQRDDEDPDWLTLFTQRRRIWWRNLIGGADVRVRVQGKPRSGYAEIVDADEATLRTALTRMYSHMMNPQQIEELIPRMVMIDIALEPEDPE